jgi:hypothetical protein
MHVSCQQEREISSQSEADLGISLLTLDVWSSNETLAHSSGNKDSINILIVVAIAFLARLCIIKLSRDRAVRSQLAFE